MTRSISFVGLELLDHRRPICLFVVGIMAGANDLASCCREYARLCRRRGGRAVLRDVVRESDQLWVMRMSIMHLWEVGCLLGDWQLRDELLRVQLPLLEVRRADLAARIERHPLLVLRTDVSAHYRAKAMGQGLKLLRDTEQVWMEEFSDRTVEHSAFKTPAVVFLARATEKLTRGDPKATEDHLRSASKEAFNEIGALLRDIREFLGELLHWMKKGRFDVPGR